MSPILYALLLTDSIVETLIVPIHHGYVLKAMVGFEYQPLFLLIGIALIGNVIGLLINWIIGRALRTCGAHYSKEANETPGIFERMTGWAGRYGKWVLLLAGVPGLGGVLAILAGGLKMRFTTTLLFICIAEILWYSWAVLA